MLYSQFTIDSLFTIIMEKKIIYHIIFWEEDEMIGRVQIDELKTEIIWKLFKQFGRTRTDNTSFEVKESFEE